MPYIYIYFTPVSDEKNTNVPYQEEKNSHSWTLGTVVDPKQDIIYIYFFLFYAHMRWKNTYVLLCLIKTKKNSQSSTLGKVVGLVGGGVVTLAGCTQLLPQPVKQHLASPGHAASVSHSDAQRCNCVAADTSGQLPGFSTVVMGN